MAALTITAANVLASANSRIVQETAGVAITQGQALYKDGASNTVKLASSTAAATAVFYGIALSAAGASQPVSVLVYDDDFTPGGTLDLTAAAGKGIYVLGATAGAIHPVSDLVATWIPVVVFVAKSASKARFNPVLGSTALS